MKSLSRGTDFSHLTSLPGFVLGKLVLYDEISNKLCDLSLLLCAHSLSPKALGAGGGGQCGKKNLLHCALSLSPKAEL